MIRSGWLVAILLACSIQPLVGAENTLTREEIAAGWISLFDGETLFGWQAHSNADWKAEQGTLTASSGTAGLLCTTSPFADYTLKLEFRAAKEANSGIFLRTLPSVTKDDLTTQCYELNIAGEENPFPTGSLVNRVKCPVACHDEGWRSLEATLQGGQMRISYNGRQVLEYVDPHPIGRGLIGLQFREGKVEFRNIRLKPLGLESLFNGRDLTGWKEYPEMASRFTTTAAGTLHVRDGKGQLESAGQYADFMVQFDCYTHAPLLNSGLFFRCIPGEQMNGYECQIHNGCKEGDRNQPLDCGTGGIYRRVNARRVVASDEEWFTTTLLAEGAHIAAWVNGYQVTDWTDTRKPDANPRKGLRREAGTLMIQGHDPTTDISFRRLQIQELPVRGVEVRGEDVKSP